MLIGYSLAPRQRYTVGHCGTPSVLYRVDLRTGKTWLYDFTPLPVPEPTTQTAAEYEKKLKDGMARMEGNAHGRKSPNLTRSAPLPKEKPLPKK